MQETDGVLGTTQAYAIARLQVERYLAIEMDSGIIGKRHPQFDIGPVINNDRPVGQRMRAQRNQRDTGQGGMQDRPASRKCIRRRAGRRRNDQAIRTQVVDEFAIDEQLEFDHPPDRPFIHDNIVQRHVGGDFLAITDHFGRQQHALFRDEAVVQQILHARQHVLPCNIGHKTQTPLIDPDQRHAVASQAARRIEHGTVPPQHDGDIGMSPYVIETTGNPTRKIDLPADMFSRLALDKNGDSSLVKIFGEAAQGFGNLQAMVLADQGDGPGRKAFIHEAEFLHKKRLAVAGILFCKISAMLDERARSLLKTLVEHYIADGQPVGSRSLSKFSGLDLSPATIRNVMADLEEAGFVASPHTSAGRIPTARGYRLFVDSLLTVRPLEARQMGAMEEALQGLPSSQIIANASQLLSSLTHFAGVVVAPRRATNRIRQIEFLSLAEKRILLIIVTSDGDVQNRILTTERAYSQSELVSAANYLNQNYVGLDFEQIRNRLGQEIQRLRDDIKPLMTLALEAGDAALSDSNTPYVISGEKNLLDVEELSSNMKRLRELFDLFDQRSSLLRLLDVSNRAEGVQIFIGGESGIAPLDECSVVTAPYTVDGQVVGSLGVIGPTRMAYERVIPIVDITARLLSSALSGKPA